jgi:hypothetical protein
MLRYCLFLFLSSDVDFASGNRLLHANWFVVYFAYLEISIYQDLKCFFLAQTHIKGMWFVRYIHGTYMTNENLEIRERGQNYFYTFKTRIFMLITPGFKCRVCSCCKKLSNNFSTHFPFSWNTINGYNIFLV